MKTLGKASLFVIAVVAITFSILPEAHAQKAKKNKGMLKASNY